MNHDVVIVGAGIAGVAAAHYLSEAAPGLDILLIDRRQPLSFTTAASGENFRAHWPQPCMAALAGRSVALMESLEADIGMKFSGYDFVSSDGNGDAFTVGNAEVEEFREPDEIARRFPYLADDIRQVTRHLRAGAVDVQALGGALLRSARANGVELRSLEIQGVEQHASGYRLRTDAGTDAASLQCAQLVLAAGPFNGPLAAQLGVDLPCENFLQTKIMVPDPREFIPRNMPFTIFAGPQRLGWSEEEQEMIADDPEFTALLDEFPPGLHIKPEGRDRIKLGWAYNRRATEPGWHAPADDRFADIVMRGASRFIPALGAYVADMPTPVVSMAGYYTRTPENWPLIGPLERPGLYTIAALSGFGTMVACAAGELLTAHITGTALPGYARHFEPNRYTKPDILAEMASITNDGQL